MCLLFRFWNLAMVFSCFNLEHPRLELHCLAPGAMCVRVFHLVFWATVFTLVQQLDAPGEVTQASFSGHLLRCDCLDIFSCREGYIFFSLVDSCVEFGLLTK